MAKKLQFFNSWENKNYFKTTFTNDKVQGTILIDFLYNTEKH